MPNTKLQRALSQQSAPKMRNQARAIFANAHGNKKAVDLAKGLMRGAARKSRR